MSSLVERYAERIAGLLSCLDRVVIMGTLPGACYAQGMTHFLYRRGVRIFDYPQFAKPLADQVSQRRASGRRSGHGHRARQEAQQLSQGGAGAAGAGTAWRSSRPGACDLGNGSLRCLPALARQADPQDLHPAGQRQVPALLFLFRGRQVRTDLPARPDLGTVPPAILLQRPQLAGAQAGRPRHRLHHGRQRLRADRGLAACAGPGRQPGAGAVASRIGSLCHAVLPGRRGIRAGLPLEPDAGGIRHRPGVPLHRHAWSAL